MPIAVPKTDWKMPTTLPRLDAAKVISIDCETYDPDLEESGPSVRSGGYIAGIAIGADDERAWYLPIRHATGANLDSDMVLRWAREELTRPSQDKLGHNLLYDLDYLVEAGVHVEGELYDTSLAEPLIDEHAYSYSLDALARKYLDERKHDELLYEWCHRSFGGKPGRKQAGNIWRAPASLVGPYGEQDARLPFKIHKKQLALLESEQLLDIYNLERALVPMILAMRRVGVRVDGSRSQELSNMLDERIIRESDAITALIGRELNVNAAKDIAQAFDMLGLEYPTTEKGAPSFVKEFLEKHPHELTNLILNQRKWAKFKGTFADGYIDRYAIGDRIHAQFHQLRTDKNGTISGRFSSSDPNLQNIPIRDEELGPMMRSLFICEPEHFWYSADYSQIEFRILLHFASGEVAESIRETYRTHPKTDYHALVSEWSGLDRKPAKNLNFGVAYGMGLDTMCAMYGWTRQQGERFMATYEENIPFAKGLLKQATKAAERRGYVRTLYGRRSRFNKWEPARRGLKNVTALTHEAAKEKWPNTTLKRAFTYSALNKVIQGTAADIMKKAMLKIWQSGVCEMIGVPQLTVHDELDWSAPKTQYAEEAMRETKHIMESIAPELKVPLIVDVERGRSWGDLSEFK
jgi:DNA polymerase I-like protein with 3'-5' exonuclease and polymerase domains